MTAQVREDRSPDTLDTQLQTALRDFTARLESQGYAASTLQEKRRYLVAFDRWSASRGLSVAEFDDQVVVEFWLGHESIKTTQMYLDADLEMKERALAKTSPLCVPHARYQPDDSLLAFLRKL